MVYHEWIATINRRKEMIFTKKQKRKERKKKIIKKTYSRNENDEIRILNRLHSYGNNDTREKYNDQLSFCVFFFLSLNNDLVWLSEWDIKKI